MLQFTKGQVNSAIVTLTELVSITNPYFLFVLRNNETKVVLKKVFSSADDQSPFINRYNEFDFPADFFDAAQPGQWKYEVYEQADALNTDETLDTIIEVGIMNLNPATVATVKKYKPQSSTNKVYNAQ